MILQKWWGLQAEKIELGWKEVEGLGGTMRHDETGGLTNAIFLGGQSYLPFF